MMPIIISLELFLILFMSVLIAVTVREIFSTHNDTPFEDEMEYLPTCEFCHGSGKMTSVEPDTNALVETNKPCICQI